MRTIWVAVLLVGCGGSSVRGTPCDPCPGIQKDRVYFGYQMEELSVCLASPQCQGAAWLQSKADASAAECARATAQWKDAQALPDFRQCVCNSACAAPPCPGC